MVSVGLLACFVFLIFRNQPFADPNLVVIARMILSLAIASLGALIPGFLNIGWSGNGIVIRAGGALGLFVLTYLFTPKVLQHDDNSKKPYPYFNVTVPAYAAITAYDPPGAFSFVNPKLRDFLNARLEDQGMFGMSISVPNQMTNDEEIKHLSEQDKAVIESESESNLTLVVRWTDYFANPQKYDPVDFAIYSFGSLDSFNKGFARTGFDRFHDTHIYVGFFQVFLVTSFVGTHFYNVQLVEPDPQRAAATYREMNNK